MLPATGAGRRPAGAGREGGLSLAGLPQRLRHAAAGLSCRPARARTSTSTRSTRSASWSRPAPTRARSSARSGESAPRAAATRRQRRLHAPIPRKSRSPTARPTSARRRSTISSSRCCKPGPGTFTPQARDVPGYTQLFDNERVRALAAAALSRAQTAGPITQTAPGLRVILDGDELDGDHQGRDGPRAGAAARRFLLAGCRRDARGPQHRDDTPSTWWSSS